MIVEAYFDAGRRGRKTPIGPAACGAILLHEGRELARRREYLGEITINDAEWSGLIMALELALEYNEPPRLGAGDELRIYSDSKLVVMQALGQWRAREERHRNYRQRAFDMAIRLRSSGCSVKISHIYREQNGKADEYVRDLLDEKTGKKR